MWAAIQICKVIMARISYRIILKAQRFNVMGRLVTLIMQIKVRLQSDPIEALRHDDDISSKKTTEHRLTYT